jgi:DNA polymerase
MYAPTRRRTAADLEARLEELRGRAAGCTACPLYRRATQTVFGAGSVRARLVVVGEQPGNDEDLRGQPFVGPAGRLLDRALTEAGVEREAVYVTNAVKHFKWKPAEGGKRRIHEKPRRDEIQACRPWFEQELELVRPSVVVCLGTTAAAAVLGRPVRIAAERGRLQPSPLGVRAMVTIHPSAILRMPRDLDRHRALMELAADLRTAARES